MRMRLIKPMIAVEVRMLIGITKAWVNLEEEAGKLRVHLSEKDPVKARLVLKEPLSRMDLNKRVAVLATAPLVNILQEVLEKPMDPLPLPTCMVVPVVDPGNIWAQAQVVEPFPLKHMVMVT